MPRNAITDQQRSALRRWYEDQGPSVRQIDAINWFESQYGRRLRQSTVSESLAERYSHLDAPHSVPTTSSSRYRNKQQHWPVLEAILLDWQHHVERQGGTVPDELLIEKAKAIWPEIPEYYDRPLPEFSKSWLIEFKRRQNIKHTASVIKEGSRVIRTLCGEYAEKDIFTMNETGLYWRQEPSSGLGTSTGPGKKKDKSRISLVFCCNFLGDQRFTLWAIGKTNMPQAFRGVNLKALDIEWRSNQKAWMNTTIMAKWFQAFYEWIGSSRSVLLLLDRRRVHIDGLNERPFPPNIRIQWLPDHSTSLYQPLDQGIINHFKRIYKKLWMGFMLSCYEKGSDPVKEVNLYFALRWASQAWFGDVNLLTVYGCFRRAKIEPSQQPISLYDPLLLSQQDLEALYRRVQQAGNIIDAMNLEDFLNPAGEDDEPEDQSSGIRMAEFIATYWQQQDVVGDSDDEVVTIPVPTTAEAEYALELLLRYQEHQAVATSDDIRALRRMRKQIEIQESERA
jgi:hypothetical protein